MALLRLAYESRFALPGNLTSREALADILRRPRRNNAAANVTGALLVTDAAFTHLFEAEDGAAEATPKTNHFGPAAPRHRPFVKRADFGVPFSTPE